MKCKNCKKEDAIKYSKYSNGKFCSRECARAYSTKNKRKSINKKVSKTLTGTGNKNVKLICKECGKNFNVKWNRRKQKYCSLKCSQKAFREKTNLTEESYRIIKEKSKKRFSDINERIRMREIGRKGGFGKKGYTKGGIYYQSTLEKECFEFLEERNINFIPHKNIPNSSRVSDLYLVNKNLWIELDGIDREKRKKWLGESYNKWIEKLKIYKENDLNLIIVKKAKEFNELINKLYKI